MDTADVTVIKTNGPVIIVRDDSASTIIDNGIEIPVLANDELAEGGDDLEINTIDVSGCACTASPVGSPPDRILFTPDSGFTGETSFTYTARDEGGRISPTSATVNVTVRDIPTGQNLYVATRSPDKVRRYDPVSGTSLPDFVGAGLDFDNDVDVVFDDSGFFYISEPPNDIVRQFSPIGIEFRYAGDTPLLYADDGVNNPRGLAFRDGHLYVASQNTYAILKVDVNNGTVTTFISSATDSNIDSPKALAFDKSNNLHVSIDPSSPVDDTVLVYDTDGDFIADFNDPPNIPHDLEFGPGSNPSDLTPADPD